MGFIFMTFGASTLLVFLFRREWLLRNRSSVYLLGWNAILFLLAYVFIKFKVGNPKAVFTLKLSLLSQLIFFPFIMVFRKLYNRDPKDTFWTMDKSLMADGVFNGVYFLVAFIVPMILVFLGII